MKKFADRKRHPTNYKEGDMVLVKFNPRQFKALRGMHHNLVRKYEGPFKIVAKVGKISYLLELHPHLRIHPVFHASVLKPYHEDKDDPSRNKSQRAPITFTASHDREIEAIIDYQAKAETRTAGQCHVSRTLEGTNSGRSHLGEVRRLMAIQRQNSGVLAAVHRGRRIIG